MGQGHNTTEAPGPALEAEGDVGEDGHEGQEHGDESAAGNVAGNGRTYLVGGDDTIGVLQGGGEVAELDILGVEGLEGIVQEAFNLGVHLGAFAVVLVLGGNLHLGVATELLHLNGVLVDAGCAGCLLEGGLHGSADILGGDALVKTHDIGTAAGEVYTVAEALEGDGQDGNHDKGTGDGVRPFLEGNEVNLGVLEEVLGELVGQGHGLASLDTVIKDDARNEDGGKDGGDDTDDEGGGKALHRTGTKDVEDDTGDEGGNLTVDDGAVSVLVTVMHGQGEALAGGEFFLDALVDNHVGVHGHTQGQDQTGDTGQGKDGAEAHQDTEQQEYVAQKSHIGNDAGALVEEYHVNEHQAEGDDEGDETGTDGGGTQGRTHNLLLNDGGRGGELTGFEHVGKVFGFLNVEVTGNFGAAAGDFGVHGRIGIYQAVQDDSYLLADVVLGEAGPHGGTFGIHGHGHGRGTVAALLGTVEVHAGVGDHTAVQRSLTVTGVHLDGHQLIEVGALHKLRGLDGPQAAETGGKDIGRHGQILVHGGGVYTGGKAQAGIVPTGRREHLEEGVGHGGAVAQVAKNLAHARIHGIEVYLIALESGPEFEGGGTLEELAHTFGVLHARQFDENLAGRTHLLDVGLGNTEAVDTVAEHVEGIVNGALGLAADDGDNLCVGGIVGHFVTKLVGGENLGQAALGSHLIPGSLKQADEILAGIHVVLLGLGKRCHEVRVGAVAGKGLHQVFQLNLQHHVHTTLEVQTQVDFLFLDALVGVAEVYFLVAYRVNVGSVSDGSYGVLHKLADFGGHIVRFDKLQGLLLGIFGGLALLDAGYRGEGELPNAGDSEQNSYESDPTFALHFVIVLKYYFHNMLPGI